MVKAPDSGIDKVSSQFNKWMNAYVSRKEMIRLSLALERLIMNPGNHNIQ